MKQIFAMLKEEGTLSLHGASDAVLSHLKLAGFSTIEQLGGVIKATKAKWQATGALLKRKPAPAANPWASL